MIDRGKTYKHYKNEKIYVVLDFCMVQLNDKWVDAVIYQADNFKKFVRPLVEFEEKFVEYDELDLT